MSIELARHSRRDQRAQAEAIRLAILRELDRVHFMKASHVRPADRFLLDFLADKAMQLTDAINRSFTY